MTRSVQITSRWLPEAIADLERLQEGTEPTLRAELSSFLKRLGGNNGGTSLADALCRPAATPIAPAIDACAADLGLSNDPRAGLLGRSAVMLYAYVRLQDDIVDEPDLVPRAAVYAAEALLGEHLALFAAAVTDPRAFTLRAAVMRRFAEVAAAEVAERSRDEGSESTDWLGGKALPMAIPLVGMALVAGRPELSEPLMRFVEEVGTGLQLVNDLYNSQEDAAQGRLTPVLRWLGAAARSGGPLRAQLLNHPVLDRALIEARRHAIAAEELARAHGLGHTAEIAVRARDMIEAVPQRLCRLLLGIPVS